MRTVGLALTLSIALLGCGRQTFQGATVIPSGGNVEVYQIQNGAGIGQLPANIPICTITGNQGGSYRVTCAGSGSFRSRFYGSVYTPGRFSEWYPGCRGSCPLERSDIVSSPVAISGGQRIDFDTFSLDPNDYDGLDVVVDTEPAYFDLYIDGARIETQVYFPSAATGQVARPASIPFGLTTAP